jgi:hypothetical protein
MTPASTTEATISEPMKDNYKADGADFMSILRGNFPCENDRKAVCSMGADGKHVHVPHYHLATWRDGYVSAFILMLIHQIRC